MFAGLPGLGVGTLFFVLTALSMPLIEAWRTLRGRGSRARWRLAVTQCAFAVSIILCVVAAEMAVVWMMGDAAPRALGPARYINDQMAVNAPETLLAGPLTASLLLLGGVLLAVEVLRRVIGLSAAPATRTSGRVRGSSDTPGGPLSSPYPAPPATQWQSAHSLNQAALSQSD